MAITPEQLVSLVSNLKALGVAHFKWGEVEVSLAPQWVQVNPESDPLPDPRDEEDTWRGYTEEERFGISQ